MTNKEKEFNLSEKRRKIFDGSDMDGKRYSYHYPEEDVKEFIKRWREELDKINLKSSSGRNRLPSLVLREVSERIDNLAGEDLK